MRHHRWAGLQLWNQSLPQLPLDPRRAYCRVGLIFQSGRKGNDGAARIARCLPVLARGLRVGSKESKIYILELFGPDILDERGLASHCFQLPEQLIVIQQLDIHRGEIAVVEYICDFLAPERACADDGKAVEIASAYRFGVRHRSGLEIRTHEICEASLYEGGGGFRFRRKIHCKRQNTPENM